MFTCAEGGADHLDAGSRALCEFTGPLTGHTHTYTHTRTKSFITQFNTKNYHHVFLIEHVLHFDMLAEFGLLYILDLNISKTGQLAIKYSDNYKFMCT